MVEKEVFLTREGLKKLEDELENLKTVRRKEMADKIKTARGFGDLSENAEYDEAKNEQAQIEERILKLENMLSNAKTIESHNVSKDTIGIGSKIKILDLDFKDEMNYTIVGSAEADPLKGFISNESPVGKALIGHKVGDEIEVNTGMDVAKYKILEIL